MIELIIKNHLENQLTIPVYFEFPAQPPSRFLLIRKTDSSRENHIDSAKIVADTYAESLYEAASLNELVKNALDSLNILPEVCSSERVTDYPNHDTQNKKYRYQAVQTIIHY